MGSRVKLSNLWTLAALPLEPPVSCCHLHPGNTLAVHFHDREARIAILKAFSPLWNEAQLVQDETTHGRVSRILRQGDVVLHVQVAHIERGVKNQRAIRERKGPLGNI